MPKYFEETPEEVAKPRPACQGLRDDLKLCLLRSECCMVDKKTPKECLQLGPHPSVPDECQSLRNAFFECKRSLIDMRTRFRGKKGY